MKLKKLSASFYNNNSHLREALDNHNGNWEAGKVRGYGVVVINLNGLKFAIPLRSRIRHKASYIVQRSNERGIHGMGLDFSKALLINDDNYISDADFKIPSVQHKKIISNEFHITNKFEKYVLKYKKAMVNQDQNILGSAEYCYTTLVNYHSHL